MLLITRIITCYRELEEIYQLQSNYERAIRLTELMNDHWFLEDYIETITDTFGPEIILITMNIYIQLLLHIYIIIWQSIVNNEIIFNTILYLSLLVELIIIIGQYIYICYVCDAAFNEVIIEKLKT